MAKTPRQLQVQKMTRQSNSVTTRQLPLTTMRGLQLTLNITHTCDASPADTLTQLLGHISKVSVVLNGQDTIISLPFYALYYMNLYEFGQAPVYSIFSTASTQGTSTVSVFLPFALLRAAMPQDTLLDARMLSTCIIEVQWAGDTFTDSTSTDSGELVIDTLEYSGVSADASFGRHEYGFDSTSIDKVGTNQIKLETGSNNQYRRLWLFVKDSSGALSDSEIDNIIIKARSFHYADKNATALQNMNQLQFSTTKQTGVYVIDFTTDGLMSQRLNAMRLSELVLELNGLLATGSIDIIKEKAIFAG